MMRIGYKSEVVAFFTAITFLFFLVFLPQGYRLAAVPAWIVLQRLVARGSRNRACPPHARDASNATKDIVAGAVPDSLRVTFAMSRQMAVADRPVALVTGTNSGIGYFTAVGLAAEGYRVVCTCRNAPLSEATARKIREEAERCRLERRGDPRYAGVPEEVLVDGRFYLECDNFDSIRRFADKFRAAYLRLDVLVNNAGMLRKRLEFSNYNPQLELHTAVNFLGPLLLTELLIPLLQESGGRVVYVASAAHRFPEMALKSFWGGKSFEKLNGRLLEAVEELNRGESGSTGPLKRASFLYAFVRYGASKLFNIYHAHYIARHHKVPACSLHPGCVGTNCSRDFMPQGWVSCIYQYASLLFLKSWEEGAQTTLHCAMCDVGELKPVEPPGDTKRTEAVSPYFAECRNQTLEALLPYGWDVEEADRIVNWGRVIVGLTEK